MNELMGYEKERAEVLSIRDMLRHAEKYRQCGVRIPRGLLLSGEPGVGKTVMARSMACEGIAFVELRAAACCDDDAAEAIVEKFREAKEQAPSILLLDELDKIAGGGQMFYAQDNERVRKTLLQELDALTVEDDVLVVATCNDSSDISDELIRPGRFDRQIEIAAPDERTRRLILEACFARVAVKRDFDIETLVRNTRGFTGAKLECLVNDAGIVGLEKDEPVITEDDLRIVINKLEFGANEKDLFADSESLHRIAVHEAGHALAALFFNPDAIYGASVLPQGDSNGHIRFVPNENRVQSAAELEAEAAVMLAGHVAERVVLGEYMTGSGQDLEGATMRIHYLCAREAAYGYDMVLLGVVRGRMDFSADAIKLKAAKKVEEKLLALDARVEQLILDCADVFQTIVTALEERHVLSREELLDIKDAVLTDKAG